MKKIIIGVLLLFLLVFSACKKQTYTITFAENEYGFQYNSELIVEKNKSFELPTVTENTIYINDIIVDEKEDYTSVIQRNNKYIFVKWIDESGKELVSPIKTDKNITISPVIQTFITQKEIKLNLNKGSIDKELLKQLNFESINLPDPVKLNCSFLRWCDSDGTTINPSTIKINENSTVELFAEYEYNVEYVIQRIDSLPDEISFDDFDLINEVYDEYLSLKPSKRLKITNFDKLDAAKKKTNTLKPAKEVSDLINELLNQDSIIASDIYKTNDIDKKYNKLSNELKGYITNYSNYEVLKGRIDALYREAILTAAPFNKEVMSIQVGTEFVNKDRILELEREYNNLDENTKSVAYHGKLEYLLNFINNDKDEVKYIFSNGLNQGIYTSREQLFKAFFTDFYFFISMNHPLKNDLIDNKINSLESFISLAGDYNYGRGEMRAIGDIAGEYLLQKDINGIYDNQTEDYFLGFCNINNLYTDFLPFIYLFFAYWRLDEGYASLNNYGADLFAEAWAPTVDIGKFFYFTDETSYVQSRRMIDMFQNCACVVNNFTDINSNIHLRGYTFGGWYDNPECNGSAVTEIGNNKVLYAKWIVNEQFVDQQKIEMTEMYIYNLTTARAVVNKTTVSYARNLYNTISNQGKSLVTNYNKLVELENQVG